LLGNDPCGVHSGDHLAPELLIAIKDQLFLRGSPTIMSDDEGTVEHAERNRWRGEEIHDRNRFPMVSKEGQTALGPVRISRCSLHPTGDSSSAAATKVKSSPHP
jgi:hypothetical protein